LATRLRWPRRSRSYSRPGPGPCWRRTGELIGLYWRLGRLILERQVADGWGTKVVERLSNDLRAEFAGMRGLSPTNLDYMRRFAAAWPDIEIPPQVVGRLPWGYVRELLDKLDDPATRERYASQAVEQGWSRAVLANQTMSQLHERSGRAPSNFGMALPAGDSELMQQLTKDPYQLEFLTLAASVAERDSRQHWSPTPSGSCSSSAPASRSSGASGASTSTATSSSSTC
jgi:predicted nuclease of restriction endonuclease-like (RecB) superfamily